MHLKKGLLLTQLCTREQLFAQSDPDYYRYHQEASQQESLEHTAIVARSSVFVDIVTLDLIQKTVRFGETQLRINSRIFLLDILIIKFVHEQF